MKFIFWCKLLELGLLIIELLLSAGHEANSAGISGPVCRVLLAAQGCTDPHF